MLIKLLEEKGWETWRNFRLKALSEEPNAFAETLAEAHQLNDDAWKGSLSKNDIFVAVKNNEVIGCVGFYIQQPKKMNHKGKFGGMFVTKEHRGKGVAKKLLQHLIEHASKQTIKLHCDVNVDNYAAINLYLKLGFRIYGFEPRALKIGDNYIDNYLMVLTF